MSSSPVPRRTAWLLVAGGFAGLALGVALGITFSLGLVFVGFLGGLAYALGVSGLAERKWIALPAFALGLAAPFLLTFGGHSVLMQRIGHVEHCFVKGIDEHRYAKRPAVEYLMACPSGEIELSRDWDDRLAVMEADVLTGHALRPVFADSTRWNLVLVTSVPLAMILLVPVARALRKVP